MAKWKSGIDPKILKQVARALDPDDVLGLWEDPGQPRISGPGFATSTQKISELSTKLIQLHSTTARSFEVFTVRGWGLTNVNVDVQGAALAAFDSGDAAGADAIIAKSIDDLWLTTFPIKQIKWIYKHLHGVVHIGTIGDARWNLLRNAQGLHLEKNYAASVPLVLNAVEGLIADAYDGKLFFSNSDRRKINLLEPRTLVGMSCSLKVLHTLFTESVNETTTKCTLSRHGIMHGRVLGYGTNVASAKCWTLLDAVVELLLARNPEIAGNVR